MGKKMTFALAFCNRGFMPGALIYGAREDMIKAVTDAGYDYIAMDAELTRYGGIETRDEGLLYAKWLKEHEGQYDGVIFSMPIFADENAEIERILALDIPAMRAYMHLDTVFTQVDHDKFTIHPGILRTLRVFELKKGENTGELTVNEKEQTLDAILREGLKLNSVTLIQCGGKDMIVSEREQWNDGSNTLCIEPGKVVVYDRNYVTNQILRENGITVLEMPSSELSRGRGGPRCMSMPLVREAVL